MAKKKNQFDGYETINLEEEIELSDEIRQRDQKTFKKKVARFFTKIILILLIVGIALSTFSIVSYCWQDTSTQADVINKLEKRDDIFYTEKGTISDELLAKMNKFISELPEDWQLAFKRWKVAAMKEFPVKLFGNNVVSINEYDKSNLTAAGFSFSAPRLICINNSLEDEVIYNAFVHEVGHLISFELGSEHGTEEWENIYRSIKDNTDLDGYYVSDEAEFFACCFEKYYNDPEDLKSISQSAYDYMHEMQNRLIHDENIGKTFLTGITNTFNTLRVYYYHFIKKA